LQWARARELAESSDSFLSVDCTLLVFGDFGLLQIDEESLSGAVDDPTAGYAMTPRGIIVSVAIR
jgi:hypothetical protein